MEGAGMVATGQELEEKKIINCLVNMEKQDCGVP